MSNQFLIVPYKSKPSSKDSKGLKAQCLEQLKAMFEADGGQHTFKVVVLRAPAQSYLETGSQFPKVTEAALGVKEKVEGCEVLDFTIQPELGIVASQMNIPEKPPGKN